MALIGIRDTGFAFQTGFTYNLLGGLAGNVYYVAVDNSNNVYACGAIDLWDLQAVPRIAKLNSSGVLDSTFITNAGTGFAGQLPNMMLYNDVDDTILVIGNCSSYNGTSANQIISLNSDGTINTGFTYGTGFNSQVNVGAFDSNKKVYVGGAYSLSAYNGSTFNRFGRLNADGTIDATFNVGNSFRWTASSTQTMIYGTIVDSISNKPYVVGKFNEFNSVGIGTAICRLNTDGSYDSTFNVGTGFSTLPSLYGFHQIDVDGSGCVYYATAVASTTYNGSGSYSLFKINSDGSLNSTFMTNQGTGFGGGKANSVYVGSDGKIYVNGTFTVYNGTTVNNFIRLNSDGTLDATFIPDTGLKSQAFQVAETSESQMYLGGSITEYYGETFNSKGGGLIRIWIDELPQAPPTDLQFVSGSTTRREIGISWVNHNNGTGYNLIQYKDLSSSDGGNWVDAGTVSWSATTYTITGLRPQTYYEIRVVLVGSWYPSNSIFTTTLPPLPHFCTVLPYTVSASTCGNADGLVTITETEYFDYYDFVLTDIDGGSHAFNTSTGEATGLTSNYYFFDVSVKPAWYYLYGRDGCNFEWIKVEDSDNPATLVRLSIRPQQCQPFDRQMGRIYYEVSGLTSGSTYQFDAFTSDLSEYYSQTGITATTSFILQNCIAQCYWVRIRDEVTGCALLLDNRCVPSVALFSTGGVKKLYLAPWTDDLDYNYWSTADDDYFLEFEDTSFFLSTKIKQYQSLTSGVTGITWYEIPVLPQIVTVNQSLAKVRQGFIFTDTLTFGITKANATKWTQIATIINAENKWVYVIEDVSGFYWTGGYRHGARVSAYSFQTGLREEDNGYKLEIQAVSENKLLTNLDENYVETYIK